MIPDERASFDVTNEELARIILTLLLEELLQSRLAALRLSASHESIPECPINGAEVAIGPLAVR